MDLNPKRSTSVHPQDLSWLYSLEGVFEHAQGITVNMADLAAAAKRTAHWPNGFLKPGMLMAQHTSGTYNTYWSPWVQDQTPNTGLTTVGGILLTGGLIREYTDGTYSPFVTASIYPAKMPLQVIVSKLPALLNNALGNRAVVAGDLPAAWQAMTA